jgi:signal transduction histidine kinase
LRWSGRTLQLILLCVVATPALAKRCWALDPGKGLSEYSVAVWGPRDGLTGAAIRGIDQTDDGYLWVGGYGAAIRYDGERMARVDIEPPADVVGALATPDGLLSVGSRGEPTCVRADLTVGCPAAAGSATGDRNLAVTRGADGSIWVASSSGLKQLRDGRLQLVTPLPGDSANALHRDSQGRFWLGTNDGLYTRTDGPFTRLVSGGPVRWIFEGRHGLWVLSDRALTRFVAGVPTVYPLPPAAQVALRSRAIEDRDDNIWIGCESGLARFRLDADGPHFTVFANLEGVSDNYVTALFEDREGSLWVGTRNGALAQFTDRTLSTRQGPPSLRDESIESVCEDDDGVMWFGTRLGLTRWKDGVEKLYTTADGLPSLPIFATYPGSDGVLWVGGGGGLVRFRDGRVDGPPVFHERVFSLYRGRDGALWIGTNDGLHRLDPRLGQVQKIPTAGGFEPAQVRGMQEDDQGNLWVTSENGLGHVLDGKLVRTGPEQGGPAARADRGVFRDSDGTLWFGAGVSLIRLRQGRFRQFTAAEGLARDWLFQVMSDDQGYLWIATGRGIVRVAKRALEEVERGERDRAPSMTFDASDQRREIAARRSRTPGVWKSRDGRLWFATLRGVVTVDPRQARPNTLAPHVLIESALVDGRPVERGAANVFPPGPGNLVFHFAGVTLLEPEKARHRYRLEGFDRGWIEASTRRVAYYTNIPPGKYRFRVQASNADGVWNEVGATLDLRLRPHYYQTFWFYGVLVLAVVALALWGYRRRLAGLRGQYLAVFAERSRLARELHDSLLQGMSAAALELENARAELPPTAVSASRRLQSVEDAITASLEETRSFVWDLRGQPSGAGELGTAVERVVGRLCDERAVACQTTLEGAAVHLPHEVQGGIFRVAQEAVANACKHAGARAVAVTLRYEPGRVRLVVRDDGHGFDPGQVPGAEAGHFGLVGMRERAQSMGATLEIKSDAGGTTVELCVPTEERHAPGG